MIIYIAIVMSVIEEISRMSKVGCSNKELLDYIYENYDEIECELNGNEYIEPKKCYYDLCINCNLEMTIDYQKSTLVCTNCGLCEYYPVYVASYNHTMQPLTGPAEPVRPLRPCSDQTSCHLWSKPCNFSVQVGPIIVRLRFFSNGRTNNCQIEVLFKWSDQS